MRQQTAAPDQHRFATISSDVETEGAVQLLVLVAQVSAFFVGLTVVGLVVGYAAERFTTRRIWNVDKPAGQFALEVRGNITFVLVSIATLTAALHFNLARLGDESFGRGALTFVSLLLGFQVFYYVFHRALHTHALVRFHRHHHESRVTTPLSGQSMSFVEALGWMIGYVAMPIAFSFIAPISFYGWMAYLVFNVVGNIVGHGNFEPINPKRTNPMQPGFIYHALHHARWVGHYGFESTYMDRLFGTLFHDWSALHERVWNKQPLLSLKERAE
jgi:Delta7-sterol 5-desaturase